jgi:coenzyme F420-dependent glucose-6-phosphate dehydrogenase
MIIGYKAGPEQFPPMELLNYTVEAEKAGFEFLDVSDHFHPWAERGQSCFTWTWLGAVAIQTAKMIIGPGVTCPILRYHPSIIAQASATLEVMAPGRTYLGVGTGEALNEYSAMGQWPGYMERQDMLREAIMLIRDLWKGEPVTYNGVYYKVKKAKLYTCPENPPPLYISSLTPNSAFFAGRYGDGLFTVGGREPEAYKQMFANFEKGATEAGKDPKGMPKIVELIVAYTDDKRAGAQAIKQYWGGTFVPALFTEKIYTPTMSEMNGEAVGADTIEQKSCISTKTEDHISFVKQYADLGFTHAIFLCPGPDHAKFIKMFGKEVIPALK